MHLVRLDEVNSDETAQVITRAFQEDPFQSHIIPDPEKRRMLPPAFFFELFRYGVRVAEVWSTDGFIKGLAVWLAPNRDATPGG
jgi:hypothetical protein